MRDGLSVAQVYRFELPYEIEGIPSNRLILSGVLALRPDVHQPDYNIYQAAHIFFGRDKRWLINRIYEIGLDVFYGHPLAPRRYEKDMRWTLDEIERVAHILWHLKRLPYPRFVITLHLIAWTARAFDLYV